MALSRYLLQIIDRESGLAIQLEPGMSAEIEFVEECIQRISAKGVGLGCTTAHVLLDVEAGIQEAIYSLKTRIKTDGRG